MNAQDSRSDPRVAEIEAALTEIYGTVTAGEAILGRTVKDVLAFEDAGQAVDLVNGKLFAPDQLHASFRLGGLLVHQLSHAETQAALLAKVLGAIGAQQSAVLHAAWAAVQGEVHHG